MTNTPDTPDTLLTALLEGDLKADDHAALCEQLHDDADLRRRTVRLMIVDAMLADAYPAAEPAPSLSTHLPKTHAPATGFRFPLRTAVALAAMIALVVTAWFILRPEPSPSRQPPAASQNVQPADTPITTVVSASGTVVIGDALAHAGSDHPAGLITLGSGSARFILTSGVDVQLHGATQLIIHDPMHATLKQGTVTFTCPPSAVGYTVNLSGGRKVVDLGTRFQVTYDLDGAPRTTVFEGRVEIHDPALNHARVVTAGQIATWPTGRLTIEAYPRQVVNPGFEVGSGLTASLTTHPSWLEEHPSADVRTRSVGRDAETTGLRPIGEGDAWLTLDGRPADDGELGGVYQKIGPIIDRTVYRLHVLVGERADNPTPGGQDTAADVTWGLFTGGPDHFEPLAVAVASRDLSDAMKADNNKPDTQISELTFDSTDSGRLGEDFYIRFAVIRPTGDKRTAQLLFDDVRLDVRNAPPPTQPSNKPPTSDHP